MKQTKFCEKCGRELTDSSGTYQVSIVGIGIVSNWPPYEANLCGSCSAKVRDWLFNMRQGINDGE